MSRHGKVCRDKQQYVATSRPMSRQAAVCRDKQQYVATSTTSVATSSSMSRHRRPVSRQETFVATSNAAEAKKPKFDIFDQIASPFHPRTIYIYTRFLGKEATGKIGEPLSWGFSL